MNEGLVSNHRSWTEVGGSWLLNPATRQARRAMPQGVTGLSPWVSGAKIRVVWDGSRQKGGWNPTQAEAYATLACRRGCRWSADLPAGAFETSFHTPES